MTSLLSVLFICIICLSYLGRLRSQGLNCCTSQYAVDGINCENTLTYNNETYYCMSTEQICDTCQVSVASVVQQCTQCCVTSNDVCSNDDQLSGTYFSAWTLVLIIFALSCFCCALIFLTAEQSRIKEGMSFEEAYFLPIPIVTAETDVESRSYNLPLDQPTAIARPHVAIDVPIAEPTEFAPLIYRNQY